MLFLIKDGDKNRSEPIKSLQELDLKNYVIYNVRDYCEINTTKDKCNKKFKIDINNERKLKFEQLKAKRSKLKEKYEKKRTNNSRKNNISDSTLIFTQKQNEPKLEFSHFDEQLNESIDQLKKQLNSAIRSNQVNIF